MKKIILLMGLISCFFFTSTNVMAVEAEEEEYLEIDLLYPEAKITEYTDEQGNEIILEAEPIIDKSIYSSNLDLFSNSQLKSGSYKISKQAKGSWVTSYVVTINTKQQFTNAKSMNITILKGEVSNRSLTYNSTKVIGTFRHKYGIITSTPKITTTIQKNKLIIQ